MTVDLQIVGWDVDSMINQLWDDVERLKGILKVGRWDDAASTISGMMGAASADAGLQPVTIELLHEIAVCAREEGADDTARWLDDVADEVLCGKQQVMSTILNKIVMCAMSEDAHHTELWLSGVAEEVEHEERQFYSGELERLQQLIDKVNSA